jgi:hypothetical protein
MPRYTTGLYKLMYNLNYSELGPEKWDEIKRKAGNDKMSLESLILSLLELYRTGKVKFKS